MGLRAHADIGNHAPGCIFVAAVGMKPRRITEGADADRMNPLLRHTGFAKLRAIRFRQIDPAGSDTSELAGHVFSHLVTASADPWADGRKHVRGFGPELVVHAAQ